MALSQNFQNAASYLSSSSAPSNISSAVKLELYGLYKYLTVSPFPSTTRPSMFDVPGRAKWDVWNLTGKTYQARTADVESRYLEIAQTYGWAEGSIQTSKTASTDRKADGEDGLDDEGEHASSSAGLGITVSSIASPPLDEDELRTIHGLALSNNAQGLATYLQENPDADIDAVDEYGYSPLHLAADRGNVAVVQVLLDKGANRNLTDPDNLTACQLAEVAGHDGVITVLEKSV